jgi:hypothetical protein
MTEQGIGEYFVGVDVGDLQSRADSSVAVAKQSVVDTEWNASELRRQKDIERQALRFGQPWEQAFWELKNNELGGDWAYFPETRNIVWEEFARLQADPSRRPSITGRAASESRESGIGLSGAVDLTSVRVSGAESIRFRIFDHGREDGDRVAVYVTGEVVGSRVLSPDLMITNTGEVFEILLTCQEAAKGGRISVQIQALNTGSLHPNTGGIEILSVQSLEPEAATLQKYALEKQGETGSLRFLVSPTGYFCGTSGEEVVADLLSRGILRDPILLGLDPQTVARVAAMARAELLELGLEYAGTVAANRMAALLQQHGLARAAQITKSAGIPWSIVAGVLVPGNDGADVHIGFRMEQHGNMVRYTAQQLDEAHEYTRTHAAAARDEVRQRYRDRGYLLLPGDDGWADFVRQQTLADAAWTMQNLQWPNDFLSEIGWIDIMEQYTNHDLTEIRSSIQRRD